MTALGCAAAGSREGRHLGVKEAGLGKDPAAGERTVGGEGAHATHTLAALMRRRPTGGRR